MKASGKMSELYKVQITILMTIGNNLTYSVHSKWFQLNKQKCIKLVLIIYCIQLQTKYNNVKQNLPQPVKQLVAPPREFW